MIKIKIKETDFYEGKNVTTKEIIIVVSDMHLGFVVKSQGSITKQFNESDIKSFFQQIKDSVIPCTRLIICGDFFDMWRRDLAGLFIENYEILEILEHIDENPNIDFTFVVGNHDYYLRHLKNHFYPFRFHKALKFKDANCEYRFVHGHQFDATQVEGVFDILCLSDDNLGQDMSKIWKRIKVLVNAFKVNIFSIATSWGKIKQLLEPPHVRAQKRVVVDDKDAIKYAKKCKSVLVYGHTHVPNIKKLENVIIANAGTWVTNSNPTNTYVEIDTEEQQIRIKKYIRGTITEEKRETITCPQET